MRTRSQPVTTAVDNCRECILLDEIGQPLNDRVARVLRALMPRFRRTFKMLRDDTTIVDVLEEAGRRIVQREARGGPVDRLHSYAWVTLASVAASLLRRGSARLERQSVPVGETGPVLTKLVATNGTAAQIERAILIRELIDQLPQSQRTACLWRLEGFTSQEIAGRRGCSVVAVNVLLSRARHRLRQLAGTGSVARMSHTRNSDQADVVHSARRQARRRMPRKTAWMICSPEASSPDERFSPQATSD